MKTTEDNNSIKSNLSIIKTQFEIIASKVGSNLLGRQVKTIKTEPTI